MIEYHLRDSGITIAEVVQGSDRIDGPEEMLDIMVNAGYNGCNGVIIHESVINPLFFDLRTGIAGEILQKFSNYRMRLAIVGDFSHVESKSLRDFIRESNNRGIINFVATAYEALERLDKRK